MSAPKCQYIDVTHPFLIIMRCVVTMGETNKERLRLICLSKQYYSITDKVCPFSSRVGPLPVFQIYAPFPPWILKNGGARTIPPYLLLRHVVTPSVVFQPFWGTFQSKFLQPPCISGYQGGSEISFSWFSQKWLEIQLSSKGMIFYSNSQLFKSRIRAL